MGSVEEDEMSEEEDESADEDEESAEEDTEEDTQHIDTSPSPLRFQLQSSIDTIATDKMQVKWIKGALIGSGSFGSVYLGMSPLTGSLMAVKQVELPTGTSHNEERKKSMLDALEREIELLKVLQHESWFPFFAPFE